ncbi:MAG: dihydrolipoyl dehydrogenase [Usitatibacter sp.]
MAQSFDVVVIGAGPGGYIAAVRAAQLGFRTACIEGWKNAKGELALGGTCLNVGCIPSKALLASSEEFEKVNEHLDAHGITVSGAKIDVAKMQARKDAIVAKMVKGVEYLFKKNKIAWLQGYGRFVSGGDEYTIDVGGGKETVQAKYVIIATGSRARHLPNITVDNDVVCDNEGALAFASVPKRLGVIGAGVIGLELGSVWRRLGSEVTILEALPDFLGACDEAVQKEAWKAFTKTQGLNIKMGVRIDRATLRRPGVVVDYTDEKGLAQKLECDRLVVSVGRVPNTDGLAAGAVGLKIDQRGFVEVDEQCRTNLANVFAIGDAVRGPMLAHKAEDEGVMVAEIIAGQKPHLDYACIPWIIYTSPEIAWVGKTEQQARAEGIAVKTGQFPFSINGRALGINEPVGFVKIVADAEHNEFLGAHMIGPDVTEQLPALTLAQQWDLTADEVSRNIFAHPTLSEAVKEAVHGIAGHMINL